MEIFNKKELEIIGLPHSFLVFLDEVGNPFIHFDLEKYKNPSIFPVLTITALIVSKTIYERILMPGLDEIKDNIFKNKNIYFHC